MAGVPRFNFRMAFRKAPIDRPLNCPDVAMLSRHDDAPHVVCSTISRFCRCRGIAVARDHFGGGRLLISSASDQLCLNAILRSSAIIVGGLATPQWPLATFRVSKIRSGAAGLLLRQEFTARAASLRPAILFHQFGLPLRVLLYSAFARASPSRRVQVSFLLPQYRPTAPSDRRIASRGVRGCVFWPFAENS